MNLKSENLLVSLINQFPRLKFVWPLLAFLFAFSLDLFLFFDSILCSVCLVSPFPLFLPFDCLIYCSFSYFSSFLTLGCEIIVRETNYCFVCRNACELLCDDLERDFCRFGVNSEFFIMIKGEIEWFADIAVYLFL
jgi:hypothetical protein